MCQADEFETCVNCPEDCGSCETAITCDAVLFCALECIETMEEPPVFSISCLATCTARACADVQYLIDQIIMCGAVLFFEDIHASEEDVLVECAEEVSACMGATC